MPFLLPRPRPGQNYVSVSALRGGEITLSDHMFVSPAEPDAKRTVPSLAFLITHPDPPSAGVFGQHANPYRLLFDLGLRKSAHRYAPAMQRHLESRRPYRLGPGIREQLESHGIPSSSINAVMLSHVHYDHHGDPEDFPTATFVLGHGGPAVLAHGVGVGATTEQTSTPSHQRFEPDLLAKHTVIEFPEDPTTCSSRWTTCAIGPFGYALDVFGDASVYAVPCPGHLPGHLNLLCRVGIAKWVCLCGDAFHDPRLLTGEKEVGTWRDHEGGEVCCIHLDKTGAEESIGRLRELRRCGGEGVVVELVAAHDEGWAGRNGGAFLPGEIK